MFVSFPNFCFFLCIRRFFEELDYVKEGQNGDKFIEQMRVDLPQVGQLKLQVGRTEAASDIDAISRQN